MNDFTSSSAPAAPTGTPMQSPPTRPPERMSNAQQEAPGNADPAPNPNIDSNNAGNQFDPAVFWDGPAPAGDPAPSGESAGGSSGESDNQGNFGQQLAERLNGLSFGDPVFNDDIAGQITEGNYGGVQDRLNAMGQNIVRESLAMQVQILKPFAEQLLAQVRNETQQTFSSRDNEESLVKLFPAAKNPVMAKTIQPIYAQALKNANGNREAAVEQTKEMLRFMAGASASDLNLEVAPKGEGGRGAPTSNFNWLDELTGRN